MSDTVVEKRLRLMPFYLISAEIDTDTDTIIPGTVEPIRNQHLLIESRTSNGTKTYAHTDELGLLCKVNPNSFASFPLSNSHHPVSEAHDTLLFPYGTTLPSSVTFTITTILYSHLELLLVRIKYDLTE